MQKIKIFPIFIFSLMTLFLFSGASLFKNKASSESYEPLKIAILPIGHMPGKPLTVPMGKNLVDKIVNSTQGDNFISEAIFKSTETAKDPTYVEKQIYIFIGRMLKKQSWFVVSPVDVFAEFNSLGYLRNNIDFKELNEQLHADRYLSVNIDYWDGEDYDKEGFMYVGYTAQLLDSKGQLMWGRKKEKELYRIKEDQEDVNSFVKEYYEELIRKIAKDIIYKFPKVEKKIVKKEVVIND